jgi:hypothetical protein
LIDQAILAKLSCWNLWMIASHQLWPKVGFGIGVCSAPYMVLAECLMKQYYGLVPLGSVRRLANCMASRQVDAGFYGVGCPHPAVECLVSKLNHLLQHYGCATTVVQFLQISMAYLITELSLSSNYSRVITQYTISGLQIHG